MYGSMFIQIYALAPKDAFFLHHSAFWTFKVVRGHTRSVPIESAYTTSY